MASDTIRQQIVLFGGDDYVQALGDTWTWDGNDWTRSTLATSPPTATGVALVHDLLRNVVVLYAAYGPWAQTWIFDGLAWRIDPRPRPSWRTGAGLSHDWARARTFLFGGYNSTTFAETWEYDSTGIASWTPFGSGCAGSAGTPALDSAPGSRPLLGTTFQLELRGLPATGNQVVAVGFSGQSWNGLLLPLGLGALGMTGCSLYVAPESVFFPAATPGSATLSLRIPNTSSLTGTRFFAQALVGDPGANVFGATVSNAGVGVCSPY
jgi:hypothetical protein